MANPSLSTESAIRINLRGIQHLECKRFSEAISEFSRALTTVKAVLANQDDSNMMVVNQPDSERFHQLAFQFYDDEEEKEDQDEEMMQVDQPEGQPFVFQSPIIVCYDSHCLPSAQDKEDFHSLVKFSASILFNLALSYHLAAIDVSSEIKMKKLLKKALTFYKLAYNMMQDTRNNGIMETMAIANNLGHVQLTVGDETKAKQCYEHLLSTIMFVTDSGHRQLVRHFDGFFQSVQSNVLGNFKQTAKAA